MNELSVAIAVMAALMLINVIATVVVIRDRYSETRQKLLQLLGLWLLPFVGAVLILGIHRNSEGGKGKYPEGRGDQWDDAPSPQVYRATNDMSDPADHHH